MECFSFKSGCVVRVEMRRQLYIAKEESDKAVLVIYIAAKDVLPTLHC